MPKPENIIGKGFDKRPQNINKKGAPKGMVRQVLEALEDQGYERVSKSEVTKSIEIFLNLPVSKIIEIAKDEKNSIYIRTVARRLADASDKERSDYIEKMLDRAQGKPMQSTEIKGEIETKQKVDISGLTPEQTAALLEVARKNNNCETD